MTRRVKRSINDLSEAEINELQHDQSLNRHLKSVPTDKARWAAVMRGILKYEQYPRLRAAGGCSYSKQQVHCVFPDRHKNGDEHASAVVIMDDDGFSGFNCQGCGAQLGVLALGVAAGLADTEAEVAEELRQLHDLPDSEQFIPKPRQATTFENRPKLVSLEDVKSSVTDWLIPNYVPVGAVTILQGDGGIGKSTVIADWLARVSTGRKMPDGFLPFHGPVPSLIIAAEDSPSLLKKRIGAAEANLRLINLWPDDIVFHLPESGETLKEFILAHGIRIVYIDALFSTFAPNVNSNKAEDVRRALLPLKTVALETGAVILATRHTKKEEAATANHKGLGSVDISNFARSVLSFKEHPREADTLLIGVAKQNYGKRPDSLKYRIVDKSIKTDDGHEETVGRIEWLGLDPTTADEAAAKTPSKLSAAISAILAAIEKSQTFRKQDITKAAECSADTVDKAMNALKAQGYEFKSTKSSFDGGWAVRVIRRPSDDHEEGVVPISA